MDQAPESVVPKTQPQNWTDDCICSWDFQVGPDLHSHEMTGTFPTQNNLEIFPPFTVWNLHALDDFNFTVECPEGRRQLEEFFLAFTHSRTSQKLTGPSTLFFNLVGNFSEQSLRNLNNFLVRSIPNYCSPGTFFKTTGSFESLQGYTLVCLIGDQLSKLESKGDYFISSHISSLGQLPLISQSLPSIHFLSCNSELFNEEQIQIFFQKLSFTHPTIITFVFDKKIDISKIARRCHLSIFPENSLNPSFLITPRFHEMECINFNGDVYAFHCSNNALKYKLIAFEKNNVHEKNQTTQQEKNEKSEVLRKAEIQFFESEKNQTTEQENHEKSEMKVSNQTLKKEEIQFFKSEKNQDLKGNENEKPDISKKEEILIGNAFSSFVIPSVITHNNHLHLITVDTTKFYHFIFEKNETSKKLILKSSSFPNPLKISILDLPYFQPVSLQIISNFLVMCFCVNSNVFLVYYDLTSQLVHWEKRFSFLFFLSFSHFIFCSFFLFFFGFSLSYLLSFFFVFLFCSSLASLSFLSFLSSKSFCFAFFCFSLSLKSFFFSYFLFFNCSIASM